jgi:stringent starvation protein B
MTSSRPYLIRALYEWIIDNQLTPHVVVDAELPGVHVPTQTIQNGKVTLNLAPQAVDGLLLGDDQIEFNARFSGVSKHVVAPISAVLAIFAKENGQGMMFPSEEDDGGPETPPAEDKQARSHLKVIK